MRVVVHSDALHWLLVLARMQQRSRKRRSQVLEYPDEDTNMVACQPGFTVTELVFIATTVGLPNATSDCTHLHCLLVVARAACPVLCVLCLHLKLTLYLQQPTTARWLELAGPYLDASSYIYHLLDQHQEQGEELRIQFFLAG